MTIRTDESDKEAGRLRQMRSEIRNGQVERYGVATVTVEAGEIGNAKMDVVNVYMIEGEYGKPIYRVDEERQTYSKYADAISRAKAKAETIEENFREELHAEGEKCSECGSTDLRDWADGKPVECRDCGAVRREV